MVIKTGRYGEFLARPGYPECKNTKKLVKEAGAPAPNAAAKSLFRNPGTTAPLRLFQLPELRFPVVEPASPKSHAPKWGRGKPPFRRKGRGGGSTAPPKAAGIPLMKK